MLSGTMVVLSLLAVDPESFDWPSLGIGAAIAILIALLMVLSVFAGMQVSVVELYRTPVSICMPTCPRTARQRYILHFMHVCVCVCVIRFVLTATAVAVVCCGC